MSTAAVACDLRVPVLSRVGKALADPTRCSILVCLLEGPHYPSDLAAHLGLTKANVSNHLTCLRGCGLVSATAEGRRVREALLGGLREFFMIFVSWPVAAQTPTAQKALRRLQPR